MSENANNTNEQDSLNMKKENNDEIMDFDALREQSDDVKKSDQTKQEEQKKEITEKEEKQSKENKKENQAKENNKEEQSKENKKEEATTENNKSDDLKKNDSRKSTEVSKEEQKKENKSAVSQSKKIADAKIAQELKQKETKNETKETKSKKGSKGLKIFLGSVAALLLIVYVAGFVYFSGTFYNAVTINGISVSGMNQEQAKGALDSFYKKYALKISLIDGKEEVIDGDDIAMAITLKDEFGNCFKKQKAYLWFVNMFSSYDFEIGADAKWDEGLLSQSFDKMSFLKKDNMKASKDAYVDVVDGAFTIVKEDLGSTVHVDEAKKCIEESLSKVLAEVSLVDCECYDLPSVYEDDEKLVAELDAKNEYAQNEIAIQLDDLILEPKMELYEDILEKSGDSYVISEKKVKKYVESLAKTYDTLGTDRVFTTSWDDRQIKTHGEAFGYVLNQDETTKALVDALNAKKKATVEAVFDRKGYTLQGENDIGDTYIEVNLSEQHVYAYKDGKKVAEGDCVSGNESAGHGTCIGLYAIQNKLSPTVLRGEKKPVTKTYTKKNKKGKKVEYTETTYEYEYESPVTYWMQFNGGIGLHDAAGWRSSYGGSIYYYSGSHGCVNLPLDFAKTLYQTFDVDTPVIVYFWDNDNRK